MINKVNNNKIPNIYFEYLDNVKIESKQENNIVDLFSSGSFELTDLSQLPDLSKNWEKTVRGEFESYLDMSIERLKKINNDEGEKTGFYRVLNTVSYNNFHDISTILVENYSANSNPKVNLDLQEKANLSLNLDDIKFTANVKSLNRIIEKMERKRLEKQKEAEKEGKKLSDLEDIKLSDLGDIVRGRIDCKDIHQAKEILKIIEENLSKQNKKIANIDNMIDDPRDNYKGRIHLEIIDNETGAKFELQIGSKNISDFIDKEVSINYGLVEEDGMYLVDKNNPDVFKSNFHDLIYKASPKLKEKYSDLKEKLDQVEKMYVNIMDKIYQAEKDRVFEQKKQEIEKDISLLQNLVSETFSKINKNDIINVLGG